MKSKKREINAPKFKPGDKVFMHNDPDDFEPGYAPHDEVGVVDGAEGWDYEEHCPEDPERWTKYPDHAIMYIVTVPKKLRTDPDDHDGMREVGEDCLSYYRPVGKKRSK
jgi:hypothetical protein